MTDADPTAASGAEASAGPRMPSSNPVLARILRYGAVLAAAIAVVGAVVGGLAVGATGVAGALVGTVMAAVFVAVTAISILVANRFIGNELYGILFFAIVLGGWIVKFVVFIVLFLLLRDQTWLDTTVMFIALVAGVVGSLVVDVVVVTTSRQGYVSDEAAAGPGDASQGPDEA